MTKNFGSTLISALVAALFVTVTLGAIMPAAAAPTPVGSAVMIDIDGGSGFTVGSNAWFNSGSKTFTITVERPDEVAIDTVSFGLENAGAFPVDVYTLTDGGNDQDPQWTVITDDGNGDGNPDRLGWESPPPGPTCQLVQTDCPNMNTNPGTFTVTLTPSTDFPKSVFTVAAAGAGGFTGDNSAQFTLGYDATAPVTTLSVLPASPDGSAGYYSSTPMVSLGCFDALSGCASTTYSVNGGEASTYAGAFALPDGNGVSVSFQSTDAATNVEDLQVLVFDVDTVAPSTSVTTIPGAVDGDNGYFVSTPTITLSCTDATSGCTATEYQVDGGGWTPFSDFTLPDGNDVLVEFWSVDSAGHVESTESQTFDVDTAVPDISNVLVSGWSGGLATVTFDVADATSGIATITPSQGTLDCGGFAAGDLATSCTVTGVDPADGNSNFLNLDATDVAGNAATQVSIDPLDGDTPAIDVFELTGGDLSDDGRHYESGFGPSVTFAASDATSGIKAFKYKLDDGDWTDASGGTLDLSALPDGAHSLTVRATDFAGHVATQTKVIRMGQPIYVVITTIEDVSDPWTKVGDSMVSITTKTVYAPGQDETGPVFGAKVMLEGATSGPISDEGTNLNGELTFTIPAENVADAYTYTATAMDTQIGDFLFDEVGELAARQTQVVFTALAVDSFEASEDVLGKGIDTTLSLALSWTHDGSDATGLDLSGHVAKITGLGGGNDPKGLLEVSQAGTTNGDWSEDAVVPGLYHLDYQPLHGSYESLEFLLDTGTSIGFEGGEDDPGTSFTVPTFAPVNVHWIGGYVAELAISNIDDLLDGTPEFVNLDDTVEITATIVYTPNYNGGGAVLGAGLDPVPVAGATVALFETGNLDDDAILIDDNADAITTATTDAGGVATFSVDKMTFSQALLRGGANTYRIQVFPTEVPGSLILQDVTQDDATELSGADDLTFTALELTYVTGSLDGSADPVTGTADGTESRWWFSMDNAKGDATDTAEDVASLEVFVAWSHDGSPVDGAIVEVQAGGAVLNDGVDDLTGTTTATGLTTLSIDPDDYGLDALVTDLSFVAVSAAEPLGGGAITQSVQQFDQQFLWTRVAALIDFASGSDAEVDLASLVDITLSPAYYHDEGSGAYFFDDVTFSPVDVAFTANVNDTSQAGLTELTDFGVAFDPINPTIDFTVQGGCDLPLDVGCEASIAEAGYHTYDVSIPSGTPHNLVVDSNTIDVLYTAVVLDTTTDRLTAEVGDPITVTATPYYAHTKDATGVDLGVLPSPYPNGVLVDVTADEVDVELGVAPGTHVVPGPVAAGHVDILVDNGVLADDGSESPLSLIYGGATMERVWLSMGVENLEADRTLQIRGRDVQVVFDVVYTDGVTTTTVTDSNGGYAFNANDDNPDSRFTRSLSTIPTAAATPTVELVYTGDGAGPFLPFAATWNDADEKWEATIEGIDSVLSDQTFDLSTSLQVTDDQPGIDLATTLDDTVTDALDLTFTAIELTVVESGPSFQADLAEFWYDLGTPGVFDVTAAWAHNDAAAEGATLLVEDPTLGTALAGVTVVDNGAGSYTVTIPSPALSTEIVHNVVVSQIPSLVADEGDFIDAADTFTVGTDEITDIAAAPTLVNTRVEFGWTGDYDGKFVNRGQSYPFGFELAWEHDSSAVDKTTRIQVGWNDGSVIAPATLSGGVSTGTANIVRSASGEIVLSPSVFTSSLIKAPRGITALEDLDDGVAVTWTSILMDIDDAVAGTHDAGVPLGIPARASLQHAPATYLPGVSVKVAGWIAPTVDDGFALGTPGYTQTINVLQPGPLTVFAEGQSYGGADTLAGVAAITASVNDSVALVFE